jgi:uncharacterized protein (DUF302 family)
MTGEQALITAPGRHDVPTTVELLSAALRQRAITLFATIDHGAGAREAGLDLPDEVVLIFGNPAAGTPVLRADPRAGLDLPLRILVWSRNGETQVTFRDPQALAGDFSLDAQAGVLAQLRGVLHHLVAEVTR